MESKRMIISKWKKGRRSLTGSGNVMLEQVVHHTIINGKKTSRTCHELVQ